MRKRSANSDEESLNPIEILAFHISIRSFFHSHPKNRLRQVAATMDERPNQHNFILLLSIYLFQLFFFSTHS